MFFSQWIPECDVPIGTRPPTNRVLLLDRIAQVIALVKRTNGSVAVLSLDIDGFKNINDTYGHGSGDLLLVEFAARLKGSLREFDSVIRLGAMNF